MTAQVLVADDELDAKALFRREVRQVLCKRDARPSPLTPSRKGRG